MNERRMPSGLTFKEAAFHARNWWDRRGRFLIRNPEFNDPELGLPSGILRGLPFDQLTRREIGRLVEVWDKEHAPALIADRQAALAERDA
jgi:hypothetical protein